METLCGDYWGRIFPLAIGKKPKTSVPGNLPDLKYILKDYWQVRGWDEKGRPTRSKLRDLEIMEDK